MTRWNRNTNSQMQSELRSAARIAATCLPGGESYLPKDHRFGTIPGSKRAQGAVRGPGTA